jgi:hypothetical protein
MLFAMGFIPFYAGRLGGFPGAGLVNVSPQRAAAGTGIRGGYEATQRQDPGNIFLKMGGPGWDDMGEVDEAAHAGRGAAHVGCEATLGGWEAAGVEKGGDSGRREAEKGLKEGRDLGVGGSNGEAQVRLGEDEVRVGEAQLRKIVRDVAVEVRGWRRAMLKWAAWFAGGGAVPRSSRSGRAR